MNFPVMLGLGAQLADVRYRWLANGALGAEQSAGISQPDSDFELFYIASAPPSGAEEMLVYDVTDLTNRNIAGYKTALIAAGTGGTGAHTVTVTVLAGGNPLQNALVRLSEGADSFTALTDASGVAAFSLDAATYGIAISKSGYTFTPSEIIVSGDANFTKVMTAAFTLPVPASASQTIGFITTRDAHGDALAGVTLFFSLTAGPTGTIDSFKTREFSAQSDTNGLLQAVFQKGASYKARRGKKGAQRSFTADAMADSFELPPVLGDP